MKKNWTILLLIGNLMMGGCSSSSDEEGELPLVNITVKEGMDLVGAIRYSDGAPAIGVPVSDGFDIVVTDNQGIYQMKHSPKASHVYYILPADCEITLSSYGLPGIYASIDPKREINQKDFVLKRREAGLEMDYNLICIADPQVKTASDMERFRNETVVDINNLLATQTVPTYAITLGDVIFDSPNMFNGMGTSIKRINTPVFETIGNHDHLQTAVASQGKTVDDHATENFRTMFGPINYSFNRGNTHIISMDNVIYTASQTYSAGLLDEQIEWLRKDLALVSKDKMLILCMHEPVRNDSFNNRSALFELLNQFENVHLMIGHTHYNQNYIHSSKIYEHIHGAACGNWWNSTINGDAAPNGYAVYEIHDNTMKNWYYKPTMLSADYQIRIYSPNSFYSTVKKGGFESYVYANVWNADSNWKIELYEDGAKTADMEAVPTSKNYDWAAIYYFFDVLQKSSDVWARKTTHIYRAIPTSTTSQIEVRATDRFGRVYKQAQFTHDSSEFASYAQ